MSGASGSGWTEPQLLTALGALEEARQSWARFADAGLARCRATKHASRSGQRPGHAELRLQWLEGYLDGPRADARHVSGLGNCGQCGPGRQQGEHHQSPERVRTQDRHIRKTAGPAEGC